MRVIFFTLGLVLPLFASAASSDASQDESVLREECSAYSQAGMLDCLAQKAKESENFLRQVEDAAIRDSLAKWDEDAKYIGFSKAELVRANKAFVHYRKAQCDFVASLGGGAIGNALEMRRLACATALNNLRAKQLRNAVASLASR